nr:hypothetical protein [Tanacetum cinerariifolium]
LDSLPHAHAQTTKIYYKDQDSRIMKAQESKTKTSAKSNIQRSSFKISSLSREILSKLSKTMQNMAIPPSDQRHQYLRYEGLQYIDADIANFETRLARIYRREGQSVFTSRAWRQLFDIRGPLIHDLILEFFSAFMFGDVVLDLDTARALQDPMLRLCHILIACSIAGRSQAPKKVIVTDLFYLRGIDVSSVNGEMIARLEEEVHGMHGALQGQRELKEQGDAEEQVQDDVDNTVAQGDDTAVPGDVVHEPSIPSPTPPTPPP